MKRSALLSVFLVVFTNVLGFGIIIPLLPLYAETMHATELQIGLLLASYTLMQFLFSPILGRWSDRVGRRPVLLLCLAGTALSFILLGLAQSLLVLFAARILDGVTGGNVSVAQAYISDVTDEKNRAKGLGLIGASFGLGFVFGPALGAFLSGFGYAVPSFAAAAMSILSLLLAWFMLPESLPAETREHRAATATHHAHMGFDPGRLIAGLRHPKLGRLLLILGLLTFAWSCFQSPFVLFGERQLNLTPQEEALWLSYLGLLSAIIQGGLIGRLSRRYGEPRLILVGAFSLAAGLFLLAQTFHPLALALLFPLLAIGYGLSLPSLASLSTRASRAEEVGATLGVYQAVDSLARISGNLTGPYLLGAIGTATPMLIGAVTAIPAIYLALRLMRRPVTEPVGLPGERVEEPAPQAVEES